MAIDVPVAGDPIVTSWGQDVANQLNHHFPIYTTADQSKTGNTFTTITGLTFPVTNGQSYAFNIVLWYDVGGTSTGIAIGFDHPGGSARMISTIRGNASATGTDVEWVQAVDTATGTTTTDSASARRQIAVSGNYTCTADGTFSFRYKRGGSSTTVQIYQGSGGWVVAN